MKALTVYPGHLAEGFDRYCPSCTRRLFDGKRVSPQLDFDYDADSADMAESINQLSVSGVQEKLSAIVADSKIVLTPSGGQGRYIIKPAPAYKHLRFRDQIPANEHLTMQIARQVYKIPTAENGLIFFKNGEPAYITKRFDYDADGKKIKQEDFSSLAHKTSATHGRDFKYTGSYEDAAALLKANVSAWQVQMSRFFALVVFNYLFANGDAHLKNFSLQQTSGGRLSARTCLRSVEYFDSCRGRGFRTARRPDSRSGIFRCLYTNGAPLPSRFRDLRTTNRRIAEENDSDSRFIHAGATGGLCFDRPIFPRRESQADVQTVVPGTVESVEERGIENLPRGCKI